MEASLTPWLESTLEGDLLLGNNWLHTKLDLTRHGGSLNGSWTGVYEDDSSSLEIFDVDRSRSNTVQIIQTSPLTISDGRHYIQATLTSDCETDFVRHHHDLSVTAGTLNALVTVRKYSVRYTTYGPPINRLLFLIHALDHQQGPCPSIVGSPTNILSSTQIAARLDLLNETRALGDQKFEQDEVDGDSIMSRSRDMDLRGEHPLLDNRLLEPLEDSQTGFCTQIAHPLGINAIGLNAIDNRDDIQPPSGDPIQLRNRQAVTNDDEEKKEMLLSLLNPGRPTVALAQAPPIHRRRGGRPGALEAHHDYALSRGGRRPSSQLPINDRPTSSTTFNERPPHVEQNEPSFEDNGINFASHESPPNNVSPVRPEPLAKFDMYSSGVDWMENLQFDADSAQVMRNQRSLLNMTDSWAKSQPGYKFPDGSVPIEVYKEIAVMAEPSNDIDEEPEIMEVEEAVSADLNRNVVASEEDEEDDEDGRLSWSASPSPEPPHIPSRTRQALPPDSSFESLQNNTPRNITGAPIVSPPSRGVVSGRILEDVPSSPSAEAVSINSDDEMDLEIPRGLGDESPTKFKAHGLPKTAAQTSGPNVPRSRSVVQVKDTPNAKGKNQGAHPRGVSSSQPNQTSSGTSGDLSSTSIVFGTYADPTYSTSNDTRLKVLNGANSTGVQEIRAKASEEASAYNDDVMTDEPISAARAHISSTQLQERRTCSPISRVSVEDGHNMQLLSSPASSRSPPQHFHSPIPQPMSTLDSNNRKYPANSLTNSRSTLDTEQPAKRKSDMPPSMTDPRPLKRREIKIYPFSSQASQDRISDSRQEKKASIERFRAERQSTTESSSLAGLQNRDSFTNGDPHNSVLEHEPSTSRTPQDAQRRSQISLSRTVSPTTRKSRGVDLPLAQTLTRDSTPTIFDTFKRAYPEYNGDVTHFVNQCKQMYRHEQDDTMVPKWMWDDFLIRNRTDFKDYALRCMDDGEDPGPYIRYYKDHIQKTVYEKGVLKEVGTLVKALGELGHQPPPPIRPAADRSYERSRSSLLEIGGSSSSSPSWTPQRSTRPGPSQGRQPLPTGSPRVRNEVSGGHTNRENILMQPSIKQSTNSSKAKTNPRASQKTSSRVSGRTSGLTSGLDQADEMTGDTFRDFVLGQKKMTAVTGSTKAGRNMKWPQYLAARPSLPPRKTPDVLSWRDDL